MKPRAGGDGEQDDETGDNNTDNNNLNLDEQRKRLESLLGTTNEDDDSNKKEENDDGKSLLSLPLNEWKKQLKNPPPLTAIGRERMETEISLLESLAQSDDAIPELWSLWYHARGPEAYKELEATEVLVAQGQPEAWKKAEEKLRNLIAQEGIHFVEPLNRLATLMFLQSRYEESIELCELVLAMKPWHFGALSGIVLVAQGLQDNKSMEKWARLRMPPLPKEGEEEKPKQPMSLDGLDINTRQQWVDLMLDKARANLLRGEMGLEESFQDCDNSSDSNGRSSSNGSNVSEAIDQQPPPPPPPITDEDDAWQ